MAEIFNNNFNTGDSSSSYSNQYSAQQNKVDRTNGGQVQYSHNWKRAPRPFGLNVRVPQSPIGERTQNLIKKTITELAMAPIQPVIDYFKDNENIFNGNVSAEIASLQKQQQVTVQLLEDADEVVMHTDVPSFMMDM
jgi:hypothetical protein